MIPLLSADHKDIYIDSLLFELNVTPYIPLIDSSDEERLFNVLKYLQGISTANNLEMKVDGTSLYLRGGDFPSSAIHDIGFIDPVTKEKFAELNWDAIKFGGSHLLEVPKAHEEYLSQALKVPRIPYDLQFNIVTYDTDLQSSVGIDVGTYLNANLDFFDLIHSGSFKAFVTGLNLTNRGGLSFNSSLRKLKGYLKLTQTTNLMGQIGQLSLISIGDSIPYKTAEVSADGQSIRRNVEFVEAGFSIKVDSRTNKDGHVFDFQIENSSADFTNTVDGLPVIQRRILSTRKLLAVGDTFEIARITTTEKSLNKRGLIFFKKFLQSNETFKKSNISIFVKRVE